MEIKVSGAAGACANTQGDSAANDEMSVQKDLKVESQTGKPDEKVEKAGTEVCMVMEERLERARKWEQQNRKVS